MGAKSREKVNRKLKEKGIVKKIPAESGAVEPKAGPKVELLTSATKTYRYIRETAINDSKDE